MRQFFIGSFSEGTPGCCGIYELHGFESCISKRSRKSITSDEWLWAIAYALEDETLSGAIVLFSGNEQQSRYKFSPQGLAAWLISQGEAVSSSEKVRNRNSGANIQAFLWTPSNKFLSLLQKFQEKQEKQEKENNGEYQDGASSTY